MHVPVRAVQKGAALGRLTVVIAAVVLAVAGVMVSVAAAPTAGAGTPAPPTSKSFCNENGSSPIDQSYRGIPACAATASGRVSFKGIVFSSPNGFQCIEYVERYFYVITGKRPAVVSGHLGNGREVAANIGKVYGKYYHVVKPTSHYGSSLIAGDIISMWGGHGTNPAGHVAVVTKVSVVDGEGTVDVIEENGAPDGTSVIHVHNGVMKYPLRKSPPYTVFQWVYGLPGTTPAPPPRPPAPPVAPTSLRVQSTTDSSATLAWIDASNDESGFLSRYRIGSGPWTRGPSVGVDVNSVTVTGLKANTTYTFQVAAQNSAGTRWSDSSNGSTRSEPAPPPPPPAQPAPPDYHAGYRAVIDRHATGGVSGHTGPGNSYARGPSRAKNSSLWIVCYVNGQSITGPYGTETLWDLATDGYYYSDAWVYTGSNSSVVPKCALRTVVVDKHATGGVSGHAGPGNSYSTGPTHAKGSQLTIACYVNGQSIKGPYGVETVWDLATDGFYYADPWIYTGSNYPVVPRC